jgi:molybdenum cofactor cytidylyltransferase
VTAAIVLAAGLGKRFGGGKMLAEIYGRPLIQHVLDLAAEARLDPVVVVLGADGDAVEARVEWRNETRVRNPTPEAGISGSVRLGFDLLSNRPAVERVVILLADQPRLTLAQLRWVLGTPSDPARPIVVPRFGGVPGNPILVEQAGWHLARDLQGDTGMSQLFTSRPDLVRYVEVEGTNPDVDTQADLRALHSES